MFAVYVYVGFYFSIFTGLCVPVTQMATQGIFVLSNTLYAFNLCVMSFMCILCSILVASCAFTSMCNDCTVSRKWVVAAKSWLSRMPGRVGTFTIITLGLFRAINEFEQTDQ